MNPDLHISLEKQEEQGVPGCLQSFHSFLKSSICVNLAAFLNKYFSASFSQQFHQTL